MPFRFPLSQPQTPQELFERVRELLPQLEMPIIANKEIGVTETAIAHGLNQVPRMAIPFPHCLVTACETRSPDNRNVYVRAVVPCVANILVIR